MAVPYLKRLMNTPKMKTLKRKRLKADADRKKIAGDFKRLRKSEGKRIAKQMKAKKKKKKKK